MDVKNLILLAFQIAIIGTVFSFGLRATLDDVLYLFRRPWLLLRSLLAVLVIMPILAVVLVRTFDFPEGVEVVLLALSISPTPPLLPKREAKAGGRTAYSLGLMLVLAVVAIVTTPLSVALLSHIFGRSISMSPGVIARIVVVMMLVPCAAGMIVRALWPRAAEPMAKAVGLAALVLLLLAIVVLLAGTWRQILDAIGNGAVLAIVIFVVAGLVVGHLMGMPVPEHASVLAFSSACRHPAIALTVASTSFSGQNFQGTILLYLIVSLLVGIPYIAWHRRRLAGVPSA